MNMRATMAAFKLSWKYDIRFFRQAVGRCIGSCHLWISTASKGCELVRSQVSSGLRSPRAMRVRSGVCLGTCLGRTGPRGYLTSANSHIKKWHVAMTKRKRKDFKQNKRGGGKEKERSADERHDAVNTHIVFGIRGRGAGLWNAKCLIHVRLVGHEWRGSCNCAPPAAPSEIGDDTDQQRQA